MDIDPTFYKSNYLDIREFNDEELKDHFVKFGFWEGRIGSQDMLNDRINRNKKIVEKRNKILDQFDYKKNEEIFINILIRTSKRPNAFKINIDSISISSLYRIVHLFGVEATNNSSSRNRE